MSIQVDLLTNEDACGALDSFLGERIYEFNSAATGYADGRLIAGCVRNAQGDVIGGFSGHTWRNYCELSYVWVHEKHRGQRIGLALLHAAEAEATRRGCKQIVLSTHSFQAPDLYERLGYEKKGVLEDVPLGYHKIFYAKQLQPELDV